MSVVNAVSRKRMKYLVVLSDVLPPLAVELAAVQAFLLPSLLRTFSRVHSENRIVHHFCFATSIPFLRAL